MNTNGFTAIILAAGLSSRMERFKPLLPLGSTTMIERVISLFRHSGIVDIPVVIGHNQADLDPVIRSSGARPVVNPHFEDGMFSSVVAGVRSLRKGRRRFSACPRISRLFVLTP